MIKIESRYKIEKCASQDSTRENICRLVVGDGYVVATDGKVLVHVPAGTEEARAAGHDSVALSALAGARAVQKKAFLLDVESQKLSADAQPLPLRQIEQAIPAPDRETHLEVALDVRLLANLADAMATKHVVLRFSDHYMDPIEVLPPVAAYDGQNPDKPLRGTFGVLMPFKHRDSNPRVNHLSGDEEILRVLHSKAATRSKAVRDRICALALQILEEEGT